jgi:hypothetical protein
MLDKWLTLFSALLFGFVLGWYANSRTNENVNSTSMDTTAYDALTPVALTTVQSVPSFKTKLPANPNSVNPRVRDETTDSLDVRLDDCSGDNIRVEATYYSFASQETDIDAEVLRNEARYQIQEYIAENDAFGLARHLGHENAMVRSEVIEGFGVIGGDTSVRYLGQVLFSEPDSANRLKAVALLEQLSYYAQASHFLTAAKGGDPDKKIRDAAAHALGED